MPTGVPKPSASPTRAILSLGPPRERCHQHRADGVWEGNQIITAPWPADCCMRLRARRVMAVNFSLFTGAASAASCTDSMHASTCTHLHARICMHASAYKYAFIRSPHSLSLSFSICRWSARAFSVASRRQHCNRGTWFSGSGVRVSGLGHARN